MKRSAEHTREFFTLDRLREMFTYDPETGVVCRMRTGQPLSKTNDHGYYIVYYRGNRLLAHRIAFCLMTGDWPKQMVDHINGNKKDNRWANLRDVSNTVNQQNIRGPRKDNKTGFLGVQRRGKRFVAFIRHGGKPVYLGCFERAEEAANHYLQAKRRLHSGNTL